MDFVSVEDAVEQLLRDVSAALKAINPEILIEFRQPYFGPVVSAYGNMMRVWDCPLDGCMNKKQTINLRLVSGSCAVHSDMIYWGKDDTVEGIATQLWGTVFSVPQISARLGEITEVQTAVLKNYLDFWNAHRTALMDGELKVRFAENGYDYAETENNGERIALMATSPVFEYRNDVKQSYAINVTGKDTVIVKNNSRESVTLRSYDGVGSLVEELTTPDALAEIKCPTGGMVALCC